ncbi:ABC transporter substrate-binding protein [Actinospica durhamensis]|uniref:ABC transporter substrate-binding protein n=1 Tax=Actinospica durhamensis TaxID=1508375 RepID=A0A941EY60_9ACTN|nr:ABC transporter substrate-binding protein [Actinospica durhamensis]MBR7839543.1 ABC transporter substrate-binding protein [Actinospica durhamensis]
MRPLHRFLAAISAVPVLAGGLAACSSSNSGTAPSPSSAGSTAASAAQFPVTLTASNGKVTLSGRPTRIVSLSPTATEDLFAVGAGSQVVAVDKDSDYPADVPKSNLDSLTPNAEAILKYQPDLVVASEDSNGLVAALTKVGVPVLIEPAAATLTDAYDQILQLGTATGHDAAAASTVASMKSQIATSVKQAGSQHADLSYYWELDPTYYSATSSTFIGQIVGLFGLKDIADKAAKASDGGYPQLSSEYIVQSSPSVVFLADTVCCGASATSVAARPGWSSITAVKVDDVVGLNDDVASRWGPRLTQLVAEIAAAVEKAPTK